MEMNTTQDNCSPKVRTDCWTAKLSPDQQWKLYYKAKLSDNWTEAVEWAKEELRLGKIPSHSAFYSWMATMRKLESERRLEAIAIDVAEANALGKTMPSDEAIIATFKVFALESARNGQAGTAAVLLRSVGILQDHLAKQKALSLSERRLAIIERKEARERQKEREAKEAAKRKMSPEERDRRIREIFSVDRTPQTDQPPLRMAQRASCGFPCDRKFPHRNCRRHAAGLGKL